MLPEDRVAELESELAAIKSAVPTIIATILSEAVPSKSRRMVIANRLLIKANTRFSSEIEASMMRRIAASMKLK